MLTGLKYCGGCRSPYDRKAVVERVYEKIPLVYAEKGVWYDELVVVCGCRMCCPDISGYSFGRVTYIDRVTYPDQGGTIV